MTEPDPIPALIYSIVVTVIIVVVVALDALWRWWKSKGIENDPYWGPDD